MPPTPVIEDAVAIVPVADLTRALAFYEGTLGFERRFVSPDGQFATVVHGDAALHLLYTDDPRALQATANYISIYLWVQDLDGLYDRLRSELERLPEERLRAPFLQPYGMREFHVKDPDGCLLLFGEEAKP